MDETVTNFFVKTNFMEIKLEKISKTYSIPGTDISRDVLEGISFTLNGGDSMAVIGPSGSGKSTLLNIIGTLDMPTAGRVLMDGKDISTFTENQLANIRNRNIGFVFQLHHLLPQLNLLENILVPTIPMKRNLSDKNIVSKARDLLDEVGLADKTTQSPGQLSVGECQRAAVVRALINEPGIILADEPTGSLDQESAERLGDLLVKINRDHQVSMVVVTHAESLAKKMKQIFNLQNGKLIEKD